MTDTRIGSEEKGYASAELTIRTVITSALSQALSRDAGVIGAVEEIMDELFLPGWHWAIREHMESRADEPSG